MIAHVVWDWNGTLLGDSPAMIAATIEAFAAAGLPVIDADRYRATYRHPLREFLDELAGRSITTTEWEALVPAWDAAYGRSLPDILLSPDAPAALRTVADSGRTQSLLSLARHHELMELVERFELDRWFARVDGSVTGESPQFKAVHLARHLDLIGVAPARALVVGDSVDDARAAREVGATAVLYDSGSHARSVLDAEGVPVVDSLLDALATAGIVRS